MKWADEGRGQGCCFENKGLVLGSCITTAVIVELFQQQLLKQAPFHAISSLDADLKCGADIVLVAQQLQLRPLNVNIAVNSLSAGL